MFLTAHGKNLVQLSESDQGLSSGNKRFSLDSYLHSRNDSSHNASSKKMHYSHSPGKPTKLQESVTIEGPNIWQRVILVNPNLVSKKVNEYRDSSYELSDNSRFFPII